MGRFCQFPRNYYSAVRAWSDRRQTLRQTLEVVAALDAREASRATWIYMQDRFVI